MPKRKAPACIDIEQRDDSLQIAIANPLGGHDAHTAGNQMALSNIRERLALYYDLEARLETEVSPERYEVRIVLPCQRKAR